MKEKAEIFIFRILILLIFPALTLIKNTERPVIVTEGTNTIVGSDIDKIIQKANKIIDGRYINKAKSINSGMEKLHKD